MSFCYSTPVTLDRLAVCGTGAGAEKLHQADAAFAAQAAPGGTKSAALKFSREDFERLLNFDAMGLRIVDRGLKVVFLFHFFLSA